MYQMILFQLRLNFTRVSIVLSNLFSTKRIKSNLVGDSCYKEIIQLRCVTLRFPSVYVEIHFEFFVLLCTEHLSFDSSTKSSSTATLDRVTEERPKETIVDETEGRGWMDPRWRRRGMIRGILCSDAFSIFQSTDSILALRFLIYLLSQKKKKKRKKKKRIELSSQDFLDSAGFPGINSALRKERERAVH